MSAITETVQGEMTGMAALPELRLAMSPPEVHRAVDIATLLADQNRSRILALLRDGPCCVCELAAAIGERQNNVSNHLARLRAAGLVRTCRVGGDSRRVYYERDPDACDEAMAAIGQVLR